MERRGDSTDAGDRQRLFDEHADLAERVARQVVQQYGELNGLTLEDYRQAALLAMWRATARWKPNGAPFARYAWAPCWSAVVDEIRRTDEVGRSCRAAGIRGATLSLDGPAFDRTAACLREMLADPRAARSKECYQAVAERLAGLGFARRALVFLCDVQGLAQRHAAAVLGISEVAAARLRREGIDYLRIRARYRAGRPPRP